MKRKITFLIAALMLLSLITQPMKGWGQTTYQHEITSSNTISNNQVTLSGATWSISTTVGKGSPSTSNVQYCGKRCLQFGSGGSNYYSNITFSTNYFNNYNVQSVSVIVQQNTSKSLTFTATQGSTIIGSSTQTIGNGNNAWTTMTVNTNAGSGGSLSFSFSPTVAVYINKIIVVYTSGATISITDPAAFTATSGNGTLNVTYSGITPGASSSIALYSDSGCETPIVGDCWFTPIFRTTAKGTDYSKIDYTYSENLGTPHAARTVYMKVTLSDGSKSSVTSDKVTISQKRYYTVTFNGNGGATAGSATSYTQNISDGIATHLTANQFIKANSIFIKWKDASANEYTDEQEVTLTADLTLTAQWENKYTITYKPNGAEGSDEVREYAEGTDVALISNPFTAPSSKMLLCWNTQDDGEGTDRAIGYVIENISANYTFHAKWVNKCDLTLNSNGITTTLEIPQGVAYALSAPANVPEGYAYVGWSEKSSDIAAGDVITSYNPSVSSKTLNAVFRQIVYGDFVKVESEPANWSGRYLIVREDAAGNYAFNGTVDSNWGECTAVTITSKTINKTGSGGAPENGLVIISAGSTTESYKFLFSSGKYMNWTNKKTFTEGVAAENYTLAYSTDHVSIKSSGNNYLRYNHNNGSGGLRSYDSDSSSDPLQLFLQSIDSYTGYYTSVSAPVADNITITTPTVIPDNAVLNMGSHVLTIGSGGSITIEDGGQLICSNSVAATIKKNITASTAKSGEGWYTISSPVHDGTDATIDVAHVTNLVSSTADGFKYDMLSYDENTHTWLNQKVSTTPGYESAGFTTMTKGLGYLYRSTGEPLSFIGNTNSGAVDCPLIWSSSEAYLKGFNLIGNPYPHSIAKGEDKAIDNTNLAAGYYVMSNAGGWTACNDGDEIEAKQGILVKTSAAVAGFKIQDVNYVAPSSKANNDNIKFVVANSQYEDIAYVRFDKGIGLNKINHRNADIPMLYINQNDEDYAIAMMSDDTKAFNLNFKAMTTSRYTLSLKSKGNYSYLHLIDRLTGKDIDMLLDDEYTFIGSPKDADNRFLIKLSYDGGNNTTGNDIFAYQSGSDIIINGEGELQVFDITGRQVMTTTINGVESINIPSQGVYIFRLNEKVQKIVVR